jgi:hypothetical protein
MSFVGWRAEFLSSLVGLVGRPTTTRRGMNKQRRYLSYMLRLWETSNGEREIWRASLESPGSGQRRGFATLQSLIDFLEAQTSQTALQNEQDPDHDDVRPR